MTAWRRRFTKHPASVGESYVEHFVQALGFGLRMIGCGLICLVHAVLPFVFCTKAGDMVSDVYERMIAQRRRCAEERARLAGPRQARAS